MIIKAGVMIVKDGKGWGVKYSDGYDTSYGWVDFDNAKIYDPRHLQKPEDAASSASSDVYELVSAKLVPVERITETYLR